MKYVFLLIVGCVVGTIATTIAMRFNAVLEMGEFLDWKKEQRDYDQDSLEGLYKAWGYLHASRDLLDYPIQRKEWKKWKKSNRDNVG